VTYDSKRIKKIVNGMTQFMIAFNVNYSWLLSQLSAYAFITDCNCRFI